jgi:hypothetical protein
VHEGVEIAAQWETWDREHHETATIRFENGAWTADSISSRHRTHAVLRLQPDHQVRQFLLFRDLEEADLWLGHDGQGRWGEMNGVYRDDLDGTEAVVLDTPLTTSIVIRGLLDDGFEIGETYEATVATVNVETLGVVQEDHVYERFADRSWRITDPRSTIEFDVDDDGLVIDIDGQFRRRHPDLPAGESTT